VKPVLWHLGISHYNEKVRWALAYKGIEHERRSAPPGAHMAIALALTRGRSHTFPILRLDGRTIGDSSRIIAALEEAVPEPALCPADPGDRARALELEEFFDEELGPYTRLVVVDHLLADPDLFLRAFVPDASTARRLVARAMFPAVRRLAIADLGIDDSSVRRAYDKLRAAGERFRAEVGPSGYLSDDRFTVADLTLAALVVPAVAPAQFPYPQPQRGHPLLQPIREVLSEYGILEWARDMYARHRSRSAEIAR
jgi:glutathione S-transferase